MLEILLLPLLVIALTIFLTRLIFHWGSHQLIGQVEAHMRAAEQIVRERTVPDAWVEPFRQRIASRQRAGADANTVAEIAAQARKHCLRELAALIRFYEKSNLVDSAETRAVLLSTLRELQANWASQPWEAIPEHQDPSSFPATAAARNESALYFNKQ